MHNSIKIIGANEHNLKKINVSIPKNKLVVITGPSGSGKSSLAFHTIYAEGQRRYIESLSAYARQFLNTMKKPEIESIVGLSPAISIEQKTISKNPRSTVGTLTEIYDYFRLLFARIGIPISPLTGKPIQAQPLSKIYHFILQDFLNKKIFLFASIAQKRKGEYKNLIDKIRQDGYQRISINNSIYDINQIPKLDKNLTYDIAVLIDRLMVKSDIEQRLKDSLETANTLGKGIFFIQDFITKENYFFSTHFICPESGFSIEEIEPRLFSFNSPIGACKECNGLGEEYQFVLDWVVPDKNLTIADGAIQPWKKLINSYYFRSLVESVISFLGDDPKVPFKELTKDTVSAILYGTNTAIKMRYFTGRRFKTKTGKFEGVFSILKKQWLEKDESFREHLSQYQQRIPCPSCKGKRLNKKALMIKILDNDIDQITNLSIGECLRFFKNFKIKITKQQYLISEQIIKEITNRLSFLNNVGLDYLTLARKSNTLSNGETQRIRLASQIGSALTGVLYILDEPSIGLHQKDNQKLLETLIKLRDLGNSVIVVEHDEETIRKADHIIDMGPKAGIHGGTIVAQGNLNKITSEKTSITGQYLNHIKKIPITKKRKQTKEYLIIEQASSNNLKNCNISIPLQNFVCITGVSGSGKSSLIMHTLYKNLNSILSNSHTELINCSDLKGYDAIDQIKLIDQSPIGKTPRSNPATYIGVYTAIREFFAKIELSKFRGYKAGRFSFNVPGGRCNICKGGGIVKIDMHFLSDIYVTCDECKGKRYNEETLEIEYQGYSIADILDLSIEEGVNIFNKHPYIYKKFLVLQKVGLGYMKIGQSATTLSGGEAQRVKLAKELCKSTKGKNLYIFDEPTTGLHFDDIKKLLSILHSLVDQGHSVIVIEHNLDVIKTADWIIDLGPDGGKKGGELLFSGEPKNIYKCKNSYTAKFLQKLL